MARRPGKHRRRAGPVTAAQRVVESRPSLLPRVLLRAWPFLPLPVLAWDGMRGTLLDHADAVIGCDATLCLIACLVVTPVITIARTPISKLRWWYGNWVFALGLGGLAIHLAYPPGSMGYRAAGDAVDWTGTLIVALLLPMAATSSAAAQKLLGPEWKRWQRWLVWIVWGAVAVHLLLMGQYLIGGAYLAATVPAIAVRNSRLRKGIKAWRSGGYSTGGWWASLAAFTLVSVAGVAVLFSAEVTSVAAALR